MALCINNGIPYILGAAVTPFCYNYLYTDRIKNKKIRIHVYCFLIDDCINDFINGIEPISKISTIKH